MSKSIVHAIALILAVCTPVSAKPGVVAASDWSALRAVIDGPEGEAWISFHPNSRVVVFDRNTKDWKNHRIFVTRLVNGKWTPAEPVSFTKEFNGQTSG